MLYFTVNLNWKKSKALLQTEQKKKDNKYRTIIAYISSYPCNDNNNNVFSELRTEKKYDYFSLIVLTTTLNKTVIITYTWIKKSKSRAYQNWFELHTVKSRAVDCLG